MSNTLIILEHIAQHIIEDVHLIKDDIYRGIWEEELHDQLTKEVFTESVWHNIGSITTRDNVHYKLMLHSNKHIAWFVAYK